MKASFAWRALVDVRPVAHRDRGLFPDRDFLSSRWDKLSHLIRTSLFTKVMGPLRIWMDLLLLDYGRMVAGTVGASRMNCEQRCGHGRGEVGATG